jgi:hypothetical protein
MYSLISEYIKPDLLSVIGAITLILGMSYAILYIIAELIKLCTGKKQNYIEASSKERTEYRLQGTNELLYEFERYFRHYLGEVFWLHHDHEYPHKIVSCSYAKNPNGSIIYLYLVTPVTNG